MSDLKELTEIDSIIFDIDGTLWNASNSCARAWNKALIEIGHGDIQIDFSVSQSFSGTKIDLIPPKFFSSVPSNLHAGLIKRYEANENIEILKNGGVLYPDVAETLSKLKGSKKLYIVSNCASNYIDVFLQYNKLHSIFLDHISSGKSGKPKGENIKTIIKANNLKTPIYVGDTAHDYEACLFNEIPFVFASYGFGKVDAPKYSIKSFRDLLVLSK